MIVIEPFKGKAVTERNVEIMERKGRDHPDYICDSVMDAISVALSQEYIREFGTILHHNIDKGLLAPGKTVKYFGDGMVVKPMEMIIGDRATFSIGRRKSRSGKFLSRLQRKYTIPAKASRKSMSFCSAGSALP